MTEIIAMLKLGEYYFADWVYLATLTWVVVCLALGHRQGKINLWELVTAVDRAGIDRTDGRKFYECGAFVVMTVGFSHMVLQGKLTEWYAGIYVAAFVTARWLRDREKRLNSNNQPKEGT